MTQSTTARPQEQHPAETRIVAIDCFPVRMPLKKPVLMATSRIEHALVLYVRVRTQSGVDGWGEAAASVLNAGETLAGMVAMVEQVIRPRLEGQSLLDRAGLMMGLRNAVFANGGAIAAVDMALLDALGHLRGVPLCELLGGAVRDQIRPVWIAGGSGNVDKDVAEVVALHARGARAFKLKVALGHVDDDIRIVAQLRQQLGADCEISADANMGWDIATALRFAEGVQPYRLAFLEQPVAQDVERLARVAHATSVPLGADESVHGLHDVLDLVKEKAVAGVSLKTIKLGGITPLVSLAGVADALGLSVGLAMMMESSLATAAMLHAASVVPQLEWSINLGSLFLAEDPVDAPVQIHDGMVACGRGPGIGVRVDEARLQHFKI